ncbi:MAG: hypothetical protein NC120_07375 [Ruminococcus sp.]|nr:hypothetical protein [Ruminococcus sp.]
MEENILKATAPNSSKTYYFVVHTADEYLAGTDSNIFVTLQGEKGLSESKRLNGNISGNAFERNDYDCFSVKYDHDVGEVYRIIIHTDAKYAGSDWKCDYFHISTHSIDKESSDCSQFIINEWIGDSSKKYEYTVDRGYNYSSKVEKDKYTVVSSGEINVPPNATYNHEIRTTLEYTVDYSEVTTTEIGTSSSISIDAEAFKADLDFKINNTVEKSSKVTIGSTVEFVGEISISEPSDKHRRYAVLWNQHSDDYSINMGSVNFSFSMPINRSFAGLKLIEEG